MSVSLSQLYDEAVACLSQGSMADAQREALWIIEEALGVTRLQIHANGEDHVGIEQYQHVMSLIQRRASREPLQYVLGSQEFLGLDIEVGPGVLIPRPESALLVENVIACQQSYPQPVIVDVGTGSGCLAISVALGLKKARIIALDRSVDALRIARMNAEKHGLHSRIRWLAGDLLAPLLSSSLAGKVTAIIANLPYISHNEWDRLSPDVKDFEPRLALDGGPDGLDIYRRLLREAPHVLSSEGTVSIELGLGQAELFCDEMSTSTELEIIHVQPDGQNIPRMVCLQRVSKL